MRWLLVYVMMAAVAGAADPEAQRVWTELARKRAALEGFHQEFEAVVARTAARNGVFPADGDGRRSVRRKLVVDSAGGRWREQSGEGVGSVVRVFDGAAVWKWEEGGDGVVREAPSNAPVPEPYEFSGIDGEKLEIVADAPCWHVGEEQRDCVVLGAPMKAAVANAGARPPMERLSGAVRMVFDAATGLLMARWVITVEAPPGSFLAMRVEAGYQLQAERVGIAEEARLFEPPALRQVPRLAGWDAGRVKKQLVGRMAPEMAVFNWQGQPVSLSGWRGKTVLIQVWNAACSSCRRDAGALAKLYAQYGGTKLEIMSVALDVDALEVERGWGKRQPEYAVVLGAENEMPAPYRITPGAYFVIDAQGVLRGVAKGQQYSGGLKKMLRKAGMEVQ